MNAPYEHLNYFVMSTGEAAHELGISSSTMRRWARAGRIACVTDHNGWRLFGQGNVYALRDAMQGENR
ncbi:excisionase family DNA binding protein [Lipingzhangella halophila]|uniref:Excisionase family DNA binding protein n=1 Tax=Lipingzhangella halophila TaxID=1783352 RepID=A0A7W7RLM7_9ACTN|nr:helix-turn-helix domain-containing protein [Lipingzhangella halophila]MBB4934265.1 excisionase family DNA binding protein [Lipingzhangella halophila]